MNKNKSPISSIVMQQIKDDKVKMHPGFYFTLISIAIIIISLAAGTALAYLSSIIFFWFRIINSDSMAYGARRNLGELAADFPWWVIVVFTTLTIFAVFLIKKYGTVYRHKTRYLVMIIVATSLIAGFTMSNLGIGNLNHSNQNKPQYPGHNKQFNNK